jgi:hypothetical protein
MTHVTLYDALLDRRPGLLGPKHWLANLRWMAEELDGAGGFAFRTSPMTASELDRPWAGNDFPAARRTLFEMKLALPGVVNACDYRADGLSVATAGSRCSLLLPLERYGAVIEMACAPGEPAATIEIRTPHALGHRPVMEAPADGRVMWTDGAYTLVFCFQGHLCQQSETGFHLRPDADGNLRLAIAFHAEVQQALAEATVLLGRADEVRAESRQAWEAYLASCPVARLPSDFTWQSPTGPVIYTRDEIVRRQYWHWHCLLSNVYELPFNNLKAYMTPDKSTFFGSWSNDGPECLRALARTSRHGLARHCLVEYVRTAITAAGDHAWYLHGTGEACLNRPGDVGRLSHGVPTIVTAVGEYVSSTGDASILDEPAGAGGTVWEKLLHHMRTVYERRDVNHDGLVEWANLWEGGADDKVGPFFSRASLEEWMDAVVNLPAPELEAFYVRNLCPLTNLYEQCFFLSSLQALEDLALRRGEAEAARYARARYEQTVGLLEARHWDAREGFYFDWDVRGECLTRVKNQDAFYLPRFLHNPARSARLFAHLDDPAEFNLHYTPTLARNEKGFNPKGYWSGGYWPREANYIALALDTAGYREKALELLIKALCAGTGKIITENMNPVTGADNSGITGMAYNVLVALVLSDLVKPEG